MGRPGNPAARPKFKGLPVPWIARTETETPGLLRNVRCGFAAEATDVTQPGDLVFMGADGAWQDHRNIWWVPTDPDTGGEPQFAQLHADRQRRCFDERRCQVCGLRIKGRLTFLIEERNLGETITTSHAPICGKCIPVALRHCPHWKRLPHAIVAADEFEAVAVFGDVLGMRNGSPAFVQADTVRFDDPRIVRVLAKQLVVELREWTRIDQEAA